MHLGVSPASKSISDLSDWAKGLIYEAAMIYPIEGLRKSYLDAKKSTSNFDDEDLLEMGYSPEEIVKIKGG